MELSRFFADLGIEPADQVAFCRAIEVCLSYWGPSQCWRVGDVSHPLFAGFTTSNRNNLFYKKCSARILLLGMTGQFGNGDQVAIRRSCCEYPHCLNPDHYFWGDRSQAMLETQKRSGSFVSEEIVKALRVGHQEGRKLAALSRKYRVPYHTARRICTGEIYETLDETEAPRMDADAWRNFESVCRDLINRYPEESRSFKLGIYVANELECPWHRNGEPTHKGNFGLMGECLDCMKEIKRGRCSINVTNFDFRWYWQIKRFWDQVDIRGEDECWEWLGTVKEHKAESVAYFPSPFHSTKSQTASRVAFWVSRGYTGKYRIFSQNTCKRFCCNPKHLTIRELSEHPQPTKIETINLSYGNIFDHYRESHAQSEASAADKLSPKG